MQLSYYIQFSYLGVNRCVIYEADATYEAVQRLVAQKFRLPEEHISAMQFTDGLGHVYSKELFEYFLILFPQPKQKFYVRLDFGKVIENCNAEKKGKPIPFSIIKNSNKRKRTDMDEAQSVIAYAPVRRQNCFLGALPNNNESIASLEESHSNYQSPAKRLRLMKSTRKIMNICTKPSQKKRILRL